MVRMRPARWGDCATLGARRRSPTGPPRGGARREGWQPSAGARTVVPCSAVPFVSKAPEQVVPVVWYPFVSKPEQGGTSRTGTPWFLDGWPGGGPGDELAGGAAGPGGGAGFRGRCRRPVCLPGGSGGVPRDTHPGRGQVTHPASSAPADDAADPPHASALGGVDVGARAHAAEFDRCVSARSRRGNEKIGSRLGPPSSSRPLSARSFRRASRPALGRVSLGVGSTGQEGAVVLLARRDAPGSSSAPGASSRRAGAASTGPSTGSTA
jgi:hypothetical protein